MKDYKILDIGSGEKPMPDANIYMDINPIVMENLEGTKIIWDLNKIPYPIDSNSIDKIYFNVVLEHLDTDSYSVMKELYRILKPYGQLEFTVPNSVFIAKRILFLFGTIHSNFHKAHKKYFNYSFMRQLVHDVGFFIIKEKFRYLPFRNLLAPRIEMTLLKTTN